MSQLVGSADGNAGSVYGDDIRLRYPVKTGMDARARVFDRALTYVTPYWPTKGGFCGDYANDIGILQAVYAGPLERIAQGAASRLSFAGVSRDQYGAPVAGVTCSLFHTSDRLWIMDVVSNTDGSYILYTTYSPDQHFIVFNKSGSPDVIGTTKQTLVGT